MASILSLVFQVTAIITLCLNQTGFSVQMTWNPKNFNVFTTKELHIKCIAAGSFDAAKTVLSLHIERRGQQPLVGYMQQNITEGPSMKPNFKAKGHIEPDASKSYLKLTIDSPRIEDAGDYTCVVFYMDETFTVKEEKTDVRITVDRNGIKEMMTHLMDKVSSLETLMKEQKQLNARHEEQIKAQQDIIEKQAANASYTTAFSASYDGKVGVTTGNTLVFRDVLLSTDNSYDPISGMFTAPRNGLYVFHLVVMTDWASWRIDVDLRANESTVASLYAHDNTHRDQASINRVLSLKAGDVVRPVVTLIQPPSRLYDEKHTSVFTGFLLKLI